MAIVKVHSGIAYVVLLIMVVLSIPLLHGSRHNGSPNWHQMDGRYIQSRGT